MSNLAISDYFNDSKNSRRVMAWVPPEMRRNGGDSMAANVIRQCVFQIGTSPVNPLSALVACITFMMARIVPNKATQTGFFVSYKGDVTPIFGYRGLIQLGRVHAGFREAVSDVVCPGDPWDPALPLEDRVANHEHGPDRVQTTDWVAGYTFFRWADGYRSLPVVLSGSELRERMQRIAKGRGGKLPPPWAEWPNEMAAKTVSRRALNGGRIQISNDGMFALQADSLGEAGLGGQLSRLVVSHGAASDVEQGEVHRLQDDVERADTLSATETAKQLPQNTEPDLFDQINGCHEHDELKALESRITNSAERAAYNNRVEMIGKGKR